jgi:hypothetical protein
MIELEYRDVTEGGKLEYPEEILEPRERTNKLNTHITPRRATVVRGERFHRYASTLQMYKDFHLFILVRKKES